MRKPFVRLAVEQVEERMVPADFGLDKSFGGDGIITGGGRLRSLDSDIREFINLSAITPTVDGRILAAARIGPDFERSIIRLTAEGKLDPTFSDDGIAKINFARGVQEENQNLIVTMYEQPDGKILIGANISITEPPAAGETEVYPDRIGLTRLNANGTVDQTFGIEGVVQIQARQAATKYANQVEASKTIFEDLRQILPLPDGRFIIAATLNGSRPICAGLSGRDHFCLRI